MLVSRSVSTPVGATSFKIGYLIMMLFVHSSKHSSMKKELVHFHISAVCVPRQVLLFFCIRYGKQVFKKPFSNILVHTPHFIRYYWGG